MKVGDLVKFLPCLRGMERMIGIVIGFNGSCPVVQWANGMSGVEPLEIIEVISESR